MKRRAFCRSAIGCGVAVSLRPAHALGRFAGLAGIQADIAALASDGSEIAIEGSTVTELGGSLDGSLLLPGNENYESARLVWNGMIDKRPALIARCASAGDVAHAVTFANERNLLLSVKGGGHSFPGKSVCDGGMMIDLSMMNSVEVDADRQEVVVEGGALLNQVDSATLSHDLVTTTGVVSHTGVGGFALGGGMGRVDRKHGLAVDNLLWAEMVTADGKIRRVSREDYPDLFWAIRGGGGNFGVAVRFGFQAHPFNPTIYGGELIYPWSQASEVLRYYAEFSSSLPDAANLEPASVVSPEGDRLLIVQLCYAGDHAEGERIIAPFKKAFLPQAEQLGPRSYMAMQTSADAVYAHHQLFYLKSGYFVEVTDAAVDAIVDSLAGDFLTEVWFQHLGGASSRIDEQATAFSNRKVHSNFGIMGTWTDAAESGQRIARIREIYAAVQPHMKGFYTNLMDDTTQRTVRNYGVNHERLVQTKNAYDPGNLFRLNANVKPMV